MRFEGEITPDDHRALTRLITRYAGSSNESGSMRAANWKVLGIGAAFGVLLPIAKRTWGFAFHWPSAVIALAVFVALFALFLRQRMRRLEPRVGGSVLGRHVYTFSAEGIRDESEHSAFFTRWSGVQSVRDAGEYLVFFIDSCNGYSLPKRFLTEPGALAELQSLAASQMRPNSWA